MILEVHLHISQQTWQHTAQYHNIQQGVWELPALFALPTMREPLCRDQCYDRKPISCTRTIAVFTYGQFVTGRLVLKAYLRHKKRQLRREELERERSTPSSQMVQACLFSLFFLGPCSDSPGVRSLCCSIFHMADVL